MEPQNIKYTSDGKKVVVVGALNSKETIVQEVFVQGETEIPSGENFVVKSLHNSPSISWKEKNLLDLEKKYETIKTKCQEYIREQEKKYNNQRNALIEQTRYLKSLCGKIREIT